PRASARHRTGRRRAPGRSARPLSRTHRDTCAPPSTPWLQSASTRPCGASVQRPTFAGHERLITFAPASRTFDQTCAMSTGGLRRRLYALSFVDEFGPVYAVWTLWFNDNGITTSQISTVFILWAAI